MGNGQGHPDEKKLAKKLGDDTPVWECRARCCFVVPFREGPGSDPGFGAPFSFGADAGPCAA